MSDDFCSQCKAVFNGLSDDVGQAEVVELAHPYCGCERFSVGVGSPGIVASSETLYRMVVSPGDVDQDGNLLLDSLRDVKTKGLSVFREGATDDDIAALVIDRLSRKSEVSPRVVQALVKFSAGDLRTLGDFQLGRFFCVYDETVPRKIDVQLPRVPTHVTVLQRLYKAGTPDRKTMNTGTQKRFFELAKNTLVPITEFRDGLIAKLNARSLAGDFILQSVAA